MRQTGWGEPVVDCARHVFSGVRVDSRPTVKDHHVRVVEARQDRVMARLLDSIKLLASAPRLLAEKCVEGIEATASTPSATPS
jgi:hypothetical protein